MDNILLFLVHVYFTFFLTGKTFYFHTFWGKKSILSCFGREKANAGSLTNFEVFDFLRSRGATADPMGCLGSVSPSECKVPHFFFRLCTSLFFQLNGTASVWTGNHTPFTCVLKFSAVILDYLQNMFFFQQNIPSYMKNCYWGCLKLDFFKCRSLSTWTELLHVHRRQNQWMNFW